MKKLILFLALLCAFTIPAHAQSSYRRGQVGIGTLAYRPPCGTTSDVYEAVDSLVTYVCLNGVWSPAGSGSGTNTYIIANAPSVGTTLFHLAKLTGSPSTAVITATSDTSGAIGVVIGNAGTTGSSVVQYNGTVSCAFDGATTAGDYVTLSATVAGDCHDAGASVPSTQDIGQVLTTNTGSGTFSLDLFSPGLVTSGGNPGLVVPWSSIVGSVVANNTIANTTFATSFTQTVPAQWLWSNITAATNVTQQNSPILALSGQEWTGSSSAADVWSIQDKIVGLTSSTLTFSRSGGFSGATPAISVPAITLLDSSTAKWITNFSSGTLVTQYVTSGGSFQGGFELFSNHTFTIFEPTGVSSSLNLVADSVLLQASTRVQLVAGTNAMNIPTTPGTAGQIMKTDGASPQNLSWESIVRTFGTKWGDTTSASPLTAGSVVYLTVPYACTITAWNLSVDAGTATVDVWKIATGTAVPTVTNTITASALPAIASGTSIHSTTLTSWTVAVSAHDIFAFQLNTVATAKFAEISLECAQQ